MSKRKKIILTVLLEGMSLAVLAAVPCLIDKGSFLTLVLLPLSGFLGYYAERPFRSPIEWGLAIPLFALAVFFPLLYPGSSMWWFDMSLIDVFIAVFFALLILAGWMLGWLPWEIAKRVPTESKSARIERRVRLSIVLAIVLILLFGLWNLFFGNPVTAMIAGNDMRDWISAEADNGTVYEIRGNLLPRYDGWGMAYCFDLAIPAEHSRAELRWKNGEIRLTDGGW